MEVKEKIFAVLILSVITFSCSTVKKSTSTETKKQETTIVHDTTTIEKTDTVHVTKTETKTDTKTEFIFDTIYKENPPKIIYRSDGSFEVTGLKSAKLETSVIYQKYDSLRKQNEIEKSARTFWQNKAEEKQTIKEVKRGIPAIVWVLWTIGIILALIVGIYIGVRFRKYFIISK